MDEALVEAWNSVVGLDDTVWHLGDFAVRPKPGRVPELLKQLHGEKHLIAGNNDGPVTRGCAGWASVRDYAEIELDGRRLVLCHYPLRSWNGMGRGCDQPARALARANGAPAVAVRCWRRCPGLPAGRARHAARGYRGQAASDSRVTSSAGPVA
jgi:hypothetical protein